MYAPHHYDNLARDNDDRCTMCNDAYAQSLEGLCNECEDYCDGRLLGFQTPHDQEDAA